MACGVCTVMAALTIGQPSHLGAAKQELLDAHAASAVSSKLDMVVIVAGGIGGTLTYDGVDVCASRVAWEVCEASLSLTLDRRRDCALTRRRQASRGFQLGGCSFRRANARLDTLLVDVSDLPTS